MSFFTRAECLQRLRAQVAAGKPIIGGGAGTGISAKCAEAGGIDLIIIYNSGRFRMAGRGRLAPGYYADVTVFDANTIDGPATYDAPETPPRGIRAVFRQGVQVAGPS